MYMYTHTHDSYTLQCMPRKGKGVKSAQNGNKQMTPVLLFVRKVFVLVGTSLLLEKTVLLIRFGRKGRGDGRGGIEEVEARIIDI